MTCSTLSDWLVLVASRWLDRLGPGMRSDIGYKNTRVRQSEA